MPTVHLPDRALIRLAGPDAEHFVQNLVTLDLATLGEGESRPAALLTPQGKILFDFLVSRAGAEGLAIEIRADVADDLFRRLMLYRLRSKVEIGKPEQVLVGVSWENDSPEGLRDARFPILVRRHLGSPPEAGADLSAWHALRVAHGIAESGPDYALGDAFPHDVLLDQTGGVGFRKGCYVGQEVVSRMQHRGTARRRVLILDGEGDLPAPGTEVTIAGRSAGALGTVAGRRALAILRTDRVKEAIDAGTPLMAGEIRVTASIPAWASFGWPQAAAADA